MWLLGHESKHLRAAHRYAWEDEDAADVTVALGDLHGAMTEAGVPLLWINPVLTSVGTASTTAGPRSARGRP